MKSNLGELAYFMLCLFTAMIGYSRHGSLFWSIIDFILMPIVWCKWLILHQVNITMIERTFDFLLK